MKSKLIVILSVSLAIINAAWYLRYKTACSEFYSRIDSYQNQLAQSNSNSDETKGILQFMAESYGTRLEEDLILYPLDLERNVDKLSIFNQSRLVIYLSDTMCSSCVDQLLFDVRKSFRDSITGRILVICQFQKDEETVIWQSRQLILPGADFLRLKSAIPLLKNAPAGSPVMFVTADHGRIDFPFVQKPSTSDCLITYLDAVQKQFIH